MVAKSKTLVIMAAVLSAPAAQAACQPKEIAEYQKTARTAAGQMGLADDYCRAHLQQQNGFELAYLATKAGRQSEAQRASRDSDVCGSEAFKILSALKAANAMKALDKIENTCGPNAAPAAAPSPALR